MTSDEEEDQFAKTRPQKRSRQESTLSAAELADAGNSGDDAANNDSTSSATSKARKGSKDKGGEDPQRERKRILDRLSQRATRDRTRNKIAYLEDLVRKFETQSESDQIRDLLRQVEDLRVEKDRLARCLGQISGLVECAVNPNPNAKGAPGTGAQSNGDGHESTGESGPSPGPLPFHGQPTTTDIPMGLSPFPQKGQLATPAFTPSPSSSFAPMMDGATTSIDGSYGANYPAGVVLPSANHGLALPGAVTESLQMSPQPQHYYDGNLRVTPPPLVVTPPNAPSGGSSQGDVSPHHDFEGSAFPTNASTTTGQGKEDMIIRDSWTYCNVTLSRGLAACRRLQQIQKRQNKGKLPPHVLDWSIPIRAVKYGWDSVKAEVDPHKQPIWAVLKLVDTRVFGANQPTERLAVLAIMALTMQYYLYPTVENRDKLPTWLRTRPSQENVKNYPITVDFFVWPGVRDRFVYTHAEYSAVSTLFSMKFRENLRFLWADSFDDLFYTSQLTTYGKSSYHLSPKFESSLRKLTCWSMNADFFQTFPELADDIPKWNGPAGPLSGAMRLPPNVWVSWDYPPEVNNGVTGPGSRGVAPKLEELSDDEKEQEIQRRWEAQLQAVARETRAPGNTGGGGRQVSLEKDMIDTAPAYATATGPTGWMPDPTHDLFGSLPIPNVNSVFGYQPDPMMTHVTQPGY